MYRNKLAIYSRQYAVALFIVLQSITIVGKGEEKKWNVIATTTIINDITQNIASENIQLSCLLPVGGDPHIYEPVPEDAHRIADADMVLKNGLYLEGWIDKLINNATKATVVTVTEGIDPIKSENYHAAPDPHVWMNPMHVKQMARNITEALMQLEPEKAAYYRDRLDKYLKQLDVADSYIKQQWEKIPTEKRVLITSHDAFRYYGNRYGVRVEAAMGVSTDAEIQMNDMQHLIAVIDKTGVNAVFVESTINPKLMTQLASDNGIVVGGKLYADSVGDEEGEAGTVINMLIYNTDTIVNALLRVQAIQSEKQNIPYPLLISVFVLFAVGFVWMSIKIKPAVLHKNLSEKFSIEIQHLDVSYDRKTVLSNVNLQLSSGKLYGLLGPNGAGKSTLFKSILGLVKPDHGIITIDGKPVEQVTHKIAYIPQKEEIDWSFPATVEDIVITGRIPLKKTFEGYTATDVEKAEKAMELVGISDLKDRHISDLSGGQQQRVFIARALCQEAEIMMFDEPFVGVDVVSEEKIVQIIKNMAAQNKTILIIHHDLSKVKDYFEQVIMINQRLIAYGAVEEVFTEKNIKNTFSGRLAILQETDKYIHNQ